MTEGWWKYAYVGQKVVCVSGDWGLTLAVRIGDVLQIESMTYFDESNDVLPGVYLKFPGDPAGYHAQNFRPLDENREHSGMKVFRSILDKANQTEKQPA